MTKGFSLVWEGGNFREGEGDGVCVCGHHFWQTGREPGMVVNTACDQLNKCVIAVLIEGSPSASLMSLRIAHGYVRFEYF